MDNAQYTDPVAKRSRGRDRSTKHKVKNQAVDSPASGGLSYFVSRSRYAFLNFETFGAMTT